MEGRSVDHVVRIDIDVKDWAREVPSVERARPSRCPECGAASRPGSRRMLHGHGRRSRQAWGPPGPQSPPETTDIAVRRYQCQRSGCGATVDVLPRSLRPRRRYTTAAIALALSLWSVEERSSRAVHKAVSPWALSFEAEWSSLRRWARQAERIFGSVRPSPPQWSLRQRAERAATTLAAQAPVPMNDAPVWARAFAGAEHDR